MAGPYELQSPKDVAMEYGGNKRKIAEAARMGIVDPTSAVLAGMFIDKMRMAQAEEAAPQQTVAQEVMAPAMRAPQMGVPSGPPEAAGVAALPVPESMYNEESFAGGGIVAFANGGVTLSDVMRRATIQEQREYQTTGRLPARLQAMLSGEAGLPPPPSGAGGRATELFSSAPADAPMAMGLTPSGGLSQFYPGMAALTQSANVVPSAPAPTPDVEAIIAQAQRGEGANVHRPTSVNLTPQGVAPQNNAFTAPSAPTTPAQGAAPTGGKESVSGFEEYKRLLKEAGVSDDIYGDERKRLDEQKEEIAAGLQEDKGIAMIMAGLSGMNTKNLAEFAQKAGETGFGYYGKSKKEARQEQKDIDKANRDMRIAENALKRGDVEKYMDYKDRADQRRIQMEGVQAQRMAAAKQSGEVEIIDRYAKAKGISFDQAVQEIAKMKAEGKSPLAGYLQQLQGSGQGTVNIAELLKKYPELQPTR